MSGRPVHVVAGVLSDAAGRVLVAQRPRRAHLGGRWEFPGGKLKPGEPPEAGLARELAEELGVRVLAASPLIRVEHRYPDRVIVLDVWTVGSYGGEPYGREGQAIEWREVRSLDAAEFPPADAPVLTALRLPRRYLVTPEPGEDRDAFLEQLAARVAQGFDLVQLRAKSLDEPALVDLGRRVAEVCRRGGAKLLVNADPETARRCGADGVHLTSRRVAELRRSGSAVGGDRPTESGDTAIGRRDSAEGIREVRDGWRFLAGASCHDAGDLERARATGCDFAVLGPVRATPTHPDAPVLRWNGFARLARGAGLPVFAIGGLGVDDIAAALRSGGQGVAAIRAFWGNAPRDAHVHGNPPSRRKGWAG